MKIVFERHNVITNVWFLLPTITISYTDYYGKWYFEVSIAFLRWCILFYHLVKDENEVTNEKQD